MDTVARMVVGAVFLCVFLWFVVNVTAGSGRR